MFDNSMPVRSFFTGFGRVPTGRQSSNTAPDDVASYELEETTPFGQPPSHIPVEFGRRTRTTAKSMFRAGWDVLLPKVEVFEEILPVKVKPVVLAPEPDNPYDRAENWFDDQDETWESVDQGVDPSCGKAQVCAERFRQWPLHVLFDQSSDVEESDKNTFNSNIVVERSLELLDQVHERCHWFPVPVGPSVLTDIFDKQMGFTDESITIQSAFDKTGIRVRYDFVRPDCLVQPVHRVFCDQKEGVKHFTEWLHGSSRHKELMKEKLRLQLPNSDCQLLVGAGGATQILWADEYETALWCGPQRSCFTDEIFVEQLQKLIPTANNVRLLSKTEKELCGYELRFSSSPMVHLTFPSKELCQSAIKERSHLVACPRGCEREGVYRRQQEMCGMELSWCPCEVAFVQVEFTSALDIDFVSRVLHAHSLDLEPRMNGKEIRIESTSKVGGEWFLADDETIKSRLTGIFGRNGLSMTRCYIYRSPECYTEAEYKLDITRRLIRCAAVKHEWLEHGYQLPRDDSKEEWKKVIDAGVPWSVKIMRDEKPHVVRARVLFGDLRMGRAIIDYLVPKTPMKEIFQLSKNGTQGVLVTPMYRVVVPMPTLLRIACDDVIQSLAAGLVKGALTGSLDCEWLRVEDGARDKGNSGYSLLYVDGWSQERVKTAAAEICCFLRSTVKKVPVDSNLFGGLSSVLSPMKTAFAKDTYVVEDKLQGVLLVFGDSMRSEQLIEHISDISQNIKESAVFSAAVDLGPSRVLPIVSERFCRKFTENRRESEVDNEELENMEEHANEINFHGSLAQFETLMTEIEKADIAAMNLLIRPGTNVTPDCPICLSAIGTNFYCLEACGHFYCFPCIYQQLKTNVKQKKMSLHCEKAGCNTPLVASDIRRVLISDETIPQLWYDPYAELRTAACHEMVRSDASVLRHCSMANCEGLVMAVSEQRSKCLSCHAERCISCHKELHPGFTCAEYGVIRGKLFEVGIISKALIILMVLICTGEKCRTVIEKRHGCNNIQCFACEIVFCWICLFQATTLREVYTHLQQHHGGAGGGFIIRNDQLVGMPEDIEEEVIIAQLIDAGRVW